MPGTPRPDYVSTKRQRIAELARNCPDMAFTNLAHHIDIEWMLTAHGHTRKDGAVGVDGQTAEEYEANLEANLQNLLDRAKSGTYVAPPVRRVHIPKAGSATETRPLGIPTFEDKILQRAVLMVLEPVYETDFLDVSHGFRPGRGAHGALDSLWKQEMKLGGDWIVDVDLRKFFDTIDHGHLRDFLKRRIRDGVLLRLIGKWLNAGVLEDGCITHPEAGSPQGGVVSPILSNVFLHYVLDDWFEREVQPRLKGRSFLIRYADDFVMGFSCARDAQRVMDVLPKRFEKYGLTIHPEKTRLVPFERPSDRPEPEGRPKRTPPGSFDLLGFTHCWGRSRRGRWVVKRKTSKSRFRRGLQAIAEWCRKNRHRPPIVQHQILGQKLQGHCACYRISGNSVSPGRFRSALTWLWYHGLSHFGRAKRMTLASFGRSVKRYPLPAARAVHSVCRLAANA